MFGHELGVLAEPIARSFDLDDDRMVKQAIEKCGCDDRVAEDFAPFGKAAEGNRPADDVGNRVTVGYTDGSRGK